MRLSLFLLFSLITFCSSFELPISDILEIDPLDRVHLEFSQPRTLPEGWFVEDTFVDRETPITLTWALKQRNLDKLDKIFWEVSNPRSSHFGKYLSFKEVSDLVAPEKFQIERITRWVESFSPLSTKLTLSRDFLVTVFPVETAEKILQVKFSFVQHRNSGLRFLRSLEPYTLPRAISELVDFVGGVHRLPTPRPPRVPQNTVSNAAVTPVTIRSHYNVTDIGSTPSNSMATSQFLLQWYSSSDLSQFFSTYNIPNYKVAKVVGTNREDIPGVEASLDIQYLMGVAQNITTWFYFTSGYDNVGQEPFLEWIIALNDDPNTPLVNSVSYGDYENSISYDYLDRCNTEFQKFGTTGHSLLFASGDFGVGCDSGVQAPIWPTSSPYVTSVGGTEMVSGQEIGVTFSGGGFSNYFSMPSYQKDAVNHFLTTSTNLPDSKTYNATGRAYPDISAFATNYQVIVGGVTKNVGGTSASTPTVSAMVSLLNDARLANGLSSLGFLNQMIYDVFASSPDAYFDIVAGSNGYGTCKGFTATQGWDPITGVGSPDYSVLKQLAV